VAKRSQTLEAGIGYLHTSAVGDRDPENVTDVQRAQIEALAAGQGIGIVAWFEDLNESGGKQSRPDLDRALAYLEETEASAFLVAKQARFSRSVVDTETIVRRIEAAGARLVCGDLNVDTSTAAGKAMRQNLAMMSEWELNTRKEYWIETKQAALARGVKLAGHANLGYDFTPARTLKPNRDRRAVKALFKAAGAGASIRELVELLERLTGRLYHRQSISDILKNRVYLGEVVYDGSVIPGAHPAILTEAEWQAGQRVTKRGLKKSGTRSLLAGIARCQACGRKMGATSSGTGVRVYRCPKFGNGLPTCEAPSSIVLEGLDAFVIEAVLEWARGAGLTDHVYEARPAREPLAIARDQLEAAQAELERWAVDSAGLGLAGEVVRAGLEARQEAVAGALARLEAIEQADGAAVIRATLRELWPTLSVAERRQLIASVVERIEVRRLERGASIEERATIIWQ
jgi:DNA invertase Pin-like site-specific DNA recombinase